MEEPTINNEEESDAPPLCNKNNDFIFKEFKLNGIDKKMYNLKIFQKNQSLLFNIKIIDDIDNKIYKKEMTLEQFHNLNLYFRQYRTCLELFNNLFYKLEKKDINAIKENDSIKFEFLVGKIRNKEKISLILYSKENNGLEAVLWDLCEGIKALEEKNDKNEKRLKELEEYNKNKENEINNIELENNRNVPHNILNDKKLLIFIIVVCSIIAKAFISKKDQEILQLKKENNKLEEDLNRCQNNLENFIDQEILKLKKEIKKLKEDLNRCQNNPENLTDQEILKLKKEINNLKEDLNRCKADLNKNINPIKYKEISNSIIKLDELELVENTIKEFYKKDIIYYKLLFRATRDGFRPKDFHKKCDGINNTLILVRTQTRKRFGGFTHATWDDYSKFKNKEKGFVFSIDNNLVFYNRNGAYNIYCTNHTGPSFRGGEHDFTINYNKSMEYINETKSRYIFEGIKNFYIKDYEVFQVWF